MSNIFAGLYKEFKLGILLLNFDSCKTWVVLGRDNVELHVIKEKFQTDISQQNLPIWNQLQYFQFSLVSNFEENKDNQVNDVHLLDL